jgi:hypothetical protein
MIAAVFTVIFSAETAFQISSNWQSRKDRVLKKPEGHKKSR